MYLLQMVISDQKKRVDLPEAATIESITKGEGPILEAWVRMADVLYKIERIAKRRERLLARIAAFELRMDVMQAEVHRVKEKYRIG